MSKKTIAEVILLFTALIWGLTFPFIRAVVSEISPVVLMFWRGIIPAFIFAFFVFCSREQRKYIVKLIPAGFFLGLAFYIGYVTQAIGLQTIDSGRSAFITSLYVVFVPILSPLFRGTPPTRNDVIGCFLAIGGMVLLTDPLSQTYLNMGDFWTILAAFAFAIQIHLLQIYTRKYSADTVYSFLQVLFIGLFSALCLPFTQHSGIFQWFPTSKFAILGFIYLNVIATVVATWLQVRYQRDTTAERAAVIYVMEPVFAMIFGYILLQEVVSCMSLMGASLMILSVLWGFFVRLSKRVINIP